MHHAQKMIALTLKQVRRVSKTYTYCFHMRNLIIVGATGSSGLMDLRAYTYSKGTEDSIVSP